MLILKQSAVRLDGINASPFCAKLELFLQFYQIPYSIKHALPMHGPYKKIPFVEYQGEVLADSDLIIQRLLEDYKINVDLSELELSQARAWKMLIEEHLNWIVVYSRWIPEQSWQRLSTLFFSRLKWPLRSIIARVSRRKVEKALYSQGIGRFDFEQIMAEGNKDLMAINSLLSEQSFIAGEQFSYFDCSAYGVLKSIVNQDMPTPLTDIAAQYPHIRAYLQRVEESLPRG